MFRAPIVYSMGYSDSSFRDTKLMFFPVENTYRYLSNKSVSSSSWFVENSAINVTYTVCLESHLVPRLAVGGSPEHTASIGRPDRRAPAAKRFAATRY